MRPPVFVFCPVAAALQCEALGGATPCHAVNLPVYQILLGVISPPLCVFSPPQAFNEAQRLIHVHYSAIHAPRGEISTSHELRTFVSSSHLRGSAAPACLFLFLFCFFRLLLGDTLITDVTPPSPYPPRQQKT